MDPDQTAPTGAVYSGSTLFAPTGAEQSYRGLLCSSMRLFKYFSGRKNIHFVIMRFKG